MNSILVEGNLIADPELKTTPEGVPICTFSIGTSRFFKRSEENDIDKEVSFFDIEAWSKLAKSCGDTLQKGRGIRVVGRLKQDRWIDVDGNQHSRVKIIAEHVEFKPILMPASVEQ